MGDETVTAEECVRFQMSYTGNWIVYCRAFYCGVDSMGMCGYITKGGEGWKFVMNPKDQAFSALTTDQMKAVLAKCDELNAAEEAVVLAK